MRWRVLVGGLVLALVSACVAIPTDSEVGVVHADDTTAGSTARYLPAGPVAGAGEDEIVRGFVEAMLAYPVTRKVAAEFLTAPAAKSWRPAGTTWIYSDLEVRSDPRAGRVSVVARVDAQIDDRGRMTAVDEERTFEMRLVAVDDEWRITNPPPGVLVSATWARDYIRPFSIFFLDEARTTVVPVPVHAVLGDQLATTLVTALAGGPAGPATEGLTTAVPALGAVRSSVPVVDGVADVAFDLATARVDDEVADQILAQMAWTLGQVPGVQSVRVSGADGVLLGSQQVGGRDEGADDSPWREFGPPGAGRFVHAATGSGVRRIDGDDSRAAPGPWGRSSEDASTVAIGQVLVAAVRKNSARVTTLAGADVVDVEGDGFLSPVVDVFGAAWLVDRRGARVRVIDAAGSRALDPVQGEPWVSFAVSPDGARWAAVTTRGHVWIGRVHRSGGKVTGLGPRTPVAVAGERVQQAQWQDGATLMLLTGDSVRPLRRVRIDGFGLQPWPGASVSMPPEPIVQIAIAPTLGAPVTLRDEGGTVWIWSETRWVQVVSGATGIS